MKHIYTHENIAIVHSVKNILELNDIDSFIKNEHTLPNGARHGIDNIFIELWITNDSDYDKANKLVDSEVINPSPKPQWTCAQCQETNEGGFELCWKCQSDRDQKT